MTNTYHGYHIPGTPMVAGTPAFVARCGGPGVCTLCSREAEWVRAEQEAENKSEGDEK